MRSPSFPGGAGAMDQFVKDQLRYPEEAIRQKISGRVTLIADIDYKGHVIKVMVKKGIGFGCDEEAARIVSLMKFESLKYRGLRVVFHKTININFQLQGAVNINPQVTYSYVENKKEQQPLNIVYKFPGNN